MRAGRGSRWAVAVGGAALVALCGTGTAAGQGRADTVLRNGFVYTVDSHDSVKQALAVDDGRIVYVGSNQGVRRYIGQRTDVVNLRGRMVMPGLHEGHIHDVVNSDQKTCDLEAEPLTVPEFQARVQACLDDPELHTAPAGSPNDFLNVENLYMQFLRPAGTTPHKSMLDALGSDRPITVSAAVTGHTLLVNQKALDLGGITRTPPIPSAAGSTTIPTASRTACSRTRPTTSSSSTPLPPPPVSAAAPGGARRRADGGVQPRGHHELLRAGRSGRPGDPRHLQPAAGSRRADRAGALRAVRRHPRARQAACGLQEDRATAPQVRASAGALTVRARVAARTPARPEARARAGRRHQRGEDVPRRHRAVPGADGRHEGALPGERRHARESRLRNPAPTAPRAASCTPTTRC